MKFCDKLPKLRKANNITQEQLADMLGVSRQAVSKWESGLSIPDMEKIIEMCKIFNCQIEELLDDGVTSNTKIEKNKTLKEYTTSILNFITKSYRMFCSMKFFEKIKCVLELLFIIGLNVLFFYIIGNILISLIINLVSLLPTVVIKFMRDIIVFVYTLFSLISSTIITIHLFKIRYLNYFVIVDDKIEKTTIEERKILEKNKETIIIRDEKHPRVLKKIIINIFKFFLIFIAIPLIISFIILIFLFTFNFTLIKSGLIFLGTILVLSGCSLINYIFLEYIFKFIFNQPQLYKRIFIILIASFVLIGVGSAITFSNYLTFSKIENNIEYKETVIKVDLDDINNIYILNSYYASKDIVKIDNNLDNLEIVVEYLGEKPNLELYTLEDNDVGIDMYSNDNPLFYLNLIIKDLKNKNIRNYNEIYNYKIKEIKVNNKNLNKIK